MTQASCVQCVAAVVSRTVVDMHDRICVRTAVVARREFVEHRHRALQELQVAHFIGGADVVYVSRCRLFQNHSQCSTEVVYMDPVADLLAVAVNGERLAR